MHRYGGFQFCQFIKKVLFCIFFSIISEKFRQISIPTQEMLIRCLRLCDLLLKCAAMGRCQLMIRDHNHYQVIQSGVYIFGS